MKKFLVPLLLISCIVIGQGKSKRKKSDFRLETAQEGRCCIVDKHGNRFTIYNCRGIPSWAERSLDKETTDQILNMQSHKPAKETISSTTRTEIHAPFLCGLKSWAMEIERDINAFDTLYVYFGHIENNQRYLTKGLFVVAVPKGHDRLSYEPTEFFIPDEWDNARRLTYPPNSGARLTFDAIPQVDDAIRIATIIYNNLRFRYDVTSPDDFPPLS